MVAKAKTERVVEFVSATPAGIEVLYQETPKRLYRVRGPITDELVEHYDGEIERAPEYDWVEVPSVTTVLEVLDKPALTWWGMKVGVEGVRTLFNLGILVKAVDPNGGQQVLCYRREDGAAVVADVEQLVELLQKHRLTTNDKRDAGGRRGQSAHDALERWAESGTIPDPDLYPPEEAGYVSGLRTFLEHVEPEAEASEVMVGSIEHGFAGRYDLRFKTTAEKTVVFHRTPVRGAQYAALPKGRYLLDLKTSKGVYQGSHGRQLEAYEGASVECGYPATDGRGILLVSADGTYKFVRSKAKFEDFLAVLAVYQSNQRMKERE